MQPRSLVTGGAGFLGSHLCGYLLNKGHHVIAMDNLITGKVANIEHLQGENFKFIKHDVTEYIFLAGQIDYIWHFASPASPLDYLQLPIHTLKVGSIGTHKALGLAKEKNAAFFLASTSEIYGDPLQHPQEESYWGNVNPVGPRGVYDEAKRFAEAMTMAYHRHENVNSHIVRIFNTYGPRMRPSDGRAIPTFIPQALRNEPITIFGDGSQTRSFCFVNDLIEGIYRLMMSDYHEPVNIGNPHEMTILEMAKLIIELTNSKSEIIHQELPENDPKVRQPNASLARELLDWQAEIPIRDGLQRTIDYYKTLFNMA